MQLEIEGIATLRTVLDALESAYPMLRGTIRDHTTQQRRPFIRFFACEQDLSQDSPDTPLPGLVVEQREPLLIGRDCRRTVRSPGITLIRQTSETAYWSPLNCHERQQPLSVLGLPKLMERPNFDLPNSFARQPETSGDFRQRVIVIVPDAEAHPDHLLSFPERYVLSKIPAVPILAIVFNNRVDERKSTD